VVLRREAPFAHDGAGVGDGDGDMDDLQRQTTWCSVTARETALMRERGASTTSTWWWVASWWHKDRWGTTNW